MTGGFGSRQGEGHSDNMTKTDTWNVALGYINLKILKQLVEVDVMEMTAKYGRANIDEEIPMEAITLRRIEAINRFKDILKQLIDNIDFAIVKRGDRVKVLKLRTALENIDAKIHAVCREEYDARSGVYRLVIDETFFNIILNRLQKIKREMSAPMNNNHLIFNESTDQSIEEIFDNFVQTG